MLLFINFAELLSIRPYQLMFFINTPQIKKLVTQFSDQLFLSLKEQGGYLFGNQSFPVRIDTAIPQLKIAIPHMHLMNCASLNCIITHSPLHIYTLFAKYPILFSIKPSMSPSQLLLILLFEQI
jgi:hypothetical protein